MIERVCCAANTDEEGVCQYHRSRGCVVPLSNTDEEGISPGRMTTHKR